ncbi:MAG: hypothetical protein CML07_08395, partial [Psychrobacter sp.]|nr:hypothetical protein [Psychrobacter sp.]
MNSTLRMFLTAVSLLLLAHSGQSATLTIPIDHVTIQAGLDAANPGDIVQVYQGTYQENLLNFGGKAITLRSMNGAEVTTIDAYSSGSVFVFETSEDENAVLDGFTLKHGSAANGGGIYCSDASPTIKNCIITNNTATDGKGGGIYCESASPKILDCTITNNTATKTGSTNATATSMGGGIYCSQSDPTITNCQITDNLVQATGGAGNNGSSASTSNGGNGTTGQAGSGYGGGIYCSDSSPAISNCRIENNTAKGIGGGGGNGGSYTYSYGNGGNGGAGNEGRSYGGAIYCSTGSPTILDSILSGNILHT